MDFTPFLPILVWIGSATLISTVLMSTLDLLFFKYADLIENFKYSLFLAVICKIVSFVTDLILEKL